MPSFVSLAPPILHLSDRRALRWHDSVCKSTNGTFVFRVCSTCT